MTEALFSLLLELFILELYFKPPYAIYIPFSSNSIVHISHVVGLVILCLGVHGHAIVDSLLIRPKPLPVLATDGLYYLLV